MLAYLYQTLNRMNMHLRHSKQLYWSNSIHFVNKY